MSNTAVAPSTPPSVNTMIGLTMLHMYEPRDQWLDAITLGLAVVLSVSQVIPAKLANPRRS